MEARIIISGAVALHGIIHLMGFMKEWKLGPAGRFSGRTIFRFSDRALRFMGVLWLLACFSLLISALMCYWRIDSSWMPMGIGLVVSQTLIILYWPDAKWGTVLNIILLLITVFVFAQLQFARQVRREVGGLVAASSPGPETITEIKAAALPYPVQKWLKKSHVIGKPVPKYVHLFQKGTLRTEPKSKWLPFKAEQYFTIDPPGFVWQAEIHPNEFIELRGRDKYELGHGNMIIKAASMIPIADASGDEIDQGTLVRYMAEIIWFPQASVSDYLAWQAIDSTHALARMSYHDITASGIYTFNQDGLPIGFEGERFGQFNGKYTKEIWSVTVTRHEFVDGIPVAKESHVTWKLKTGEFEWLRLAVVDIRFEY